MKNFVEFYSVVISIMASMFIVGSLATLAVIAYERSKYRVWPKFLYVVSNYMVPSVMLYGATVLFLLISVIALAVQIDNIIQ